MYLLYRISVLRSLFRVCCRGGKQQVKSAILSKGLPIHGILFVWDIIRITILHRLVSQLLKILVVILQQLQHLLLVEFNFILHPRDSPLPAPLQLLTQLRQAHSLCRQLLRLLNSLLLLYIGHFQRLIRPPGLTQHIIIRQFHLRRIRPHRL